MSMLSVGKRPGLGMLTQVILTDFLSLFQVEILKMELAKREAKKTLLSKALESPTPTEKAPFPLRRLSNGNSSARTDKLKNPEDRSATKSPFLQPYPKPSLEGSKWVKKNNLLPNVSVDVSTTSPFESVPLPQCCPDEDAEAVSKPDDPVSSGNSELELHANAPRSPTSSSNRLIEVGVGTEISHHKATQTPETRVLTSNDTLRVVDPCRLPTDSQTPNSVCRTDGDRSQRRKSAETSRKRSTGPEKR